MKEEEWKLARTSCSTYSSLLFHDRKYNILSYFYYFYAIGASPIRRDRGRGLTPAQWARFCGRNLCADSIDKFVRTAVPDGEALMEEAHGAGGAGGAAGGEYGASGKRRRGGAKNKALMGTVGNFFRSRSVGSRHRPSWIVRKINKLAGSDGDNGGQQGNGGKNNDGRSKEEHKFVLPRVKVTPAAEGDGPGEWGGGGGGEDAFWSDDPESSPGGSPTRSLSGSNERLPDIKGGGGSSGSSKNKKDSSAKRKKKKKK